jgi:hypothetical protein
MMYGNEMASGGMIYIYLIWDAEGIYDYGGEKPSCGIMFLPRFMKILEMFKQY